MNQEQPAFLGWLRDCLPWRQVADGPTVGACWAALLRVPAVGCHAERTVLSAGDRPDQRGATR